MWAFDPTEAMACGGPADLFAIPPDLRETQDNDGRMLAAAAAVLFLDPQREVTRIGEL